MLLIQIDHSLGKASIFSPNKFLEMHPMMIIKIKGGITTELTKGSNLNPGKQPHLGIFMPKISPVAKPPAKEEATTTKKADNCSEIEQTFII